MPLNGGASCKQDAPPKTQEQGDMRHCPLFLELGIQARHRLHSHCRGLGCGKRQLSTQCAINSKSLILGATTLVQAPFRTCIFEASLVHIRGRGSWESLQLPPQLRRSHPHAMVRSRVTPPLRAPGLSLAPRKGGSRPYI